MSILGKYTENINNRDNNRTQVAKSNDYTMPAVTREDTESISLKKGITLSAIIHPATLFTLWIILTILAIFWHSSYIDAKRKTKS